MADLKNPSKVRCTVSRGPRGHCDPVFSDRWAFFRVFQLIDVAERLRRNFKPLAMQVVPLLVINEEHVRVPAFARYAPPAKPPALQVVVDFTAGPLLYCMLV